MSVADAAVRKLLRLREASDVGTLARAPSRCVAATTRGTGALTTGARLSPTLTMNVPAPVFPRASVAVQRTVVEPAGNIEPAAGEQLTATGPSTRSFALAVNANTAPPGPVASSTALPGTTT